MELTRLNPAYLFLLWAMCSFSAFSVTLEQLTNQAELGNTDAQVELALRYQEKDHIEKAHYWFVKAALQGNETAITSLGSLFELSENNVTDTLPIAENWFLIGSELGNSEAAVGYSRVLETQFNLRRAKQVSSIETLDEQTKQDQQNTPQLSDPNYVATNWGANGFLIATSTIISLLIVLTFLYLLRRTSISRNKRENKDLYTQLQEQIQITKSLKRHLNVAHLQLKKQHTTQKKSNQENSLTLACAVLCVHPDKIPSEKEIKLRYKKLSRIYHPDSQGNDEEMKRLNTAVKIIIDHIKSNAHR